MHVILTRYHIYFTHQFSQSDGINVHFEITRYWRALLRLAVSQYTLCKAPFCVIADHH